MTISTEYSALSYFFKQGHYLVIDKMANLFCLNSNGIKLQGMCISFVPTDITTTLDLKIVKPISSSPCSRVSASSHLEPKRTKNNKPINIPRKPPVCVSNPHTPIKHIKNPISNKPPYVHLSGH